MENVSDSNMSIKGSFSLTVKHGGINVEAKAEFEKLDKEAASNYSTTVDVQAQPRFTKSPTTCAEMFKQVEELDTLVNQERHFPELDKKDPDNPDFVMRVVGVPVRFKLVPISHILADHDVDPIYKLLDQDILDSFQTMVFNLRDFSSLEHVKMLLAEMEPKIIPILMDDFNPLTVEIRAYSTAKADLAVELKREAAKIYIEYKVSNGDTTDLTEMVKRYDSEFRPWEVVNDILQFKEDAKKQLAGIRASDVEGIVDEDGNPSIRFFSNATDLADWYNTERTIKILLKTDFKETSPTGVFIKLYDMSPTLAKYGIEVGVAFPNISEGQFTLTYKTQKETTIYTAKEIRFVLEVLAVSVDEGETIAKIFYSINAALYGLNLPMVEYLFDVPNLVKVMKGFNGTVICETYCELLANLTETLDTWNLVVPIQALNTGVEMMRFFRQLRVYIPQRFPNLKHRFLVSRFNNVSDKFYSPLLLIFLDNVFQAVCIDHIEILIMMEQFAKPEPDWSLISFGEIRKSQLYPPRADWAISVIQNLILDHQTFNSDPIFDLPEFPNNDDAFLYSAIQVARASAMREEPQVLTTVAHLALADPALTDALEALLSQHGWKDNQFSPTTWKDIEWSKFYQDIRNFLSNQAPALMKVVLALDELRKIPEYPPQADPPPDPPVEWNEIALGAKINAIIKFILDEPAERGYARIYKWRGVIINEDDLYDALRAEVIAYNGMPGRVRIIGIGKLFEAFIAEKTKEPAVFHVFNMTYLVEGMQDPQFKSLKHVLLPMCKRYCDRVTISDEYPRGARRLQDSLTERQLFKTLGVLSEVRYDPKLYLMHQEFFNFSTLPAPTNIKSIIEKMTGYEFDDDQLETVWTNPKFLYALRQVISNEGVVDGLYVHVYVWNQRQEEKLRAEQEENADLLGENAEINDDGELIEEKAVGDDGDLKFPAWIPPDVVEVVKALITLRTRPNYEYPKEWVDVVTMIEAFQIIFIRQAMPIDFAEVLRNNVDNVGVIRDALEEEKILFYWNPVDRLFDLPWTLDTVTRALNVLKVKYPDKNEETFDKQLVPVTISPTPAKKVEPEPESITVNYMWKPLVRGGKLNFLRSKSYLEVENLHKTARTEYDELEKAATTTLRYLVQQIRTNSSPTLSAAFFEHYIHYPPSGPRPGVIDFGDGVPTRSLGMLLSRGDLQTALFQLTDPVVTHLALMSMSKTPIPLPYLVTSIAQLPGPREGGIVIPTPTKATLLHPALQDIIVPEMEALVPQPRLFRDPYRFVLTLRVGDTTPDPGRSSLINSYLMKDPTYFSSKLDPGSEHGRPLNRNGFLEFSWLSETTCDPVFWEHFVKAEYNGQRKEVILLGLLHGDALSLSSLIEVVRPHVSCFVVFWKASNFNDLRARKKVLSGVLGKSKVLDVVMYPDSTIKDRVHEQNLIFRRDGESQDIRNKFNLSHIFLDGMSYTVKTDVEDGEGYDPIPAAGGSFLSSIASGLGTPKGSKPLSTTAPITVTPVTPVSTPESIELITFIERSSIGNIQDALANPGGESFKLVAFLVQKFAALLNLPQPQRNMSLTHLTWELDFLSRTSSAEWVERIYKLRAQIEEKFFTAKGHPPDAIWVLETQQEMRMAMAQLRRNSMSMQDIWRATWNWTEPGRESLLSVQTDYVNSGHPLELFHPTYSPATMWMHGVDDVIKSIPEATRIFVISAFGLKSSGKSTLLNSLFGAGFTEHGTTFGIQFRLLWLNEELKASTDCDAFLILDSEGVGGAENKIDVGADTLERKIITFLLGISSVTLATIIGPTMNELKEILEVSFTALGKVNTLPLTPDVYMVQQFLPGQPSAGPAPAEFNSALSSAVQVTTDLQLQTGLRVTEAHRLKQIKSRNKHAEVVHPIRSRGSEIHQEGAAYLDYHSDVEQLYSKIIHIAATTRGARLTLGNWFQSTIALWGEIYPVGVPFDRPSAIGLRENAAFEERVTDVKRAIDGAFFYHEKKAEAQFNDGLDKLFSEYVTGFDGDLERRLSALTKALQPVINTCEDALDPPSEGGRRKRKLKMAMAAEPNPNSCIACANAFKVREALLAEVLKQPRGFLVDEEITRYTNLVRDSIYERIRQGVIARQIAERQSDFSGDLFLALEAIREEFSDLGTQWTKFLQYVSTLQFVTPARHRFHAELQQVYKNLGHIASRHLPDGNKGKPDHLLPDLRRMIAFDVQIYNSALESALNARKPEKLTWQQHDWLVARLRDIPKQMKADYEAVLYRVGMVRDLQVRIHKTIQLFEEFCGEGLLPNFKWEVHFYAIQLFSKYFDEQQSKWDLDVRRDDDGAITRLEGGNPLKVLRLMEEHLTDEGFFKDANLPPAKSNGETN